SRASLPDETPIPWAHSEYAAIAFSHWSTFGPRMKCWDSRTSVMAAATSALMPAYCALRSSNGTFIHRFLLQFPVCLGADPQVRRQWGFFVQVEASQDAGLDFLIAVAAFRAPHDPARIGRRQTMAVPAHPARLA